MSWEGIMTAWDATTGASIDGTQVVLPTRLIRERPASWRLLVRRLRSFDRQNHFLLVNN
jgi:hypothetical protein